MKKYITNINRNILFEEMSVENPEVINEEIKITNKTSKFYGMGAALTQASTINYQLLSDSEKTNFINSYFKELNYKYIRLPIGSCDFSPESYDYLVFGKFNINKDVKYIHPLLNDLKKFNLTYMASPWSPPTKYKNIFGKLSKFKYEAYANYLVNYVNYYKDNGINIKYISIQNEPYAKQKWESCVFDHDEQKSFIKTLSNKLDDNTSIMMHDHNKGNLLNEINSVYVEDSKISSIAFHWYDGNHFEELNKVHEAYPNLTLIESEMCCGYSKYDEIEWIHDAELYAKEIIGNLNNYMNIYMDWNLLLDEFGGPNHKKNYVKSPIIRKENNIIKTPIYYYLKHISLHQDSTIYISSSKDLLTLVSDKYITILNNTDNNISFAINDIKDIIKKHTIITYEKDK